MVTAFSYLYIYSAISLPGNESDHHEMATRYSGVVLNGFGVVRNRDSFVTLYSGVIFLKKEKRKFEKFSSFRYNRSDVHCIGGRLCLDMGI